MASPSVSFRISRNTEELAETIHALSRRLVAMEQRLVAMERQLAQAEEAAVEEVDPQEIASLANVERLLLDCRQLLAAEDLTPVSSGVSAASSAGLADAALQEAGHGAVPRDVPETLTSLDDRVEADALDNDNDNDDNNDDNNNKELRGSGFRHAA